ncbi:hypothetical protein [Aliikangiella sp. G2MR2-5]|uniref:hypothetical protein n=1 Tax=Aliikangiella sp. G2MR2-5 TaxID=2788943 RepID=UPI0018AAD223|nr:hypothetical protein [Aliikangiella sp. G2MR2-5]
MHIQFKRVPRLAVVFYLVGLAVIGVTLLIYHYFPEWLPVQRIQQAFIGGAIIVAVGSVINSFYQFKPGQSKSGQKGQPSD